MTFRQAADSPIFFALASQESLAQRPGSQLLLAKLSELAFREALRRYAQSETPDLKGWLAGLHDPHVGHALALLHGNPARGWTVDELAREVALSRQGAGGALHRHDW